MYYWLEAIHLRRPQFFWDFWYPPSLCLQSSDIHLKRTLAFNQSLWGCWGPGLIMNCRRLKSLDLQLSAIDKPQPSPLNGWSPICKSTQRLVTKRTLIQLSNNNNRMRHFLGRMQTRTMCTCANCAHYLYACILLIEREKALLCTGSSCYEIHT